MGLGWFSPILILSNNVNGPSPCSTSTFRKTSVIRRHCIIGLSIARGLSICVFYMVWVGWRLLMELFPIIDSNMDKRWRVPIPCLNMFKILSVPGTFSHSLNIVIEHWVIVCRVVLICVWGEGWHWSDALIGNLNLAVSHVSLPGPSGYSVPDSQFEN